jgi:hypothetical protein
VTPLILRGPTAGFRLKTRAVQTLRDCRASPNFAKRLDCGAFTAAFARNATVVEDPAAARPLAVRFPSPQRAIPFHPLRLMLHTKSPILLRSGGGARMRHLLLRSRPRQPGSPSLSQLKIERVQSLVGTAPRLSLNSSTDFENGDRRDAYPMHHGFSHFTNHSIAACSDSGVTRWPVFSWMRSAKRSSAPAAW